MDEKVDTPRPEALREQILELLKAEEPSGLKITEMAERLAIPWQRLIPITRILLEEGSLSKNDKVYRLVPASGQDVNSTNGLKTPNGTEASPMMEEKKADVKKEETKSKPAYTPPPLPPPVSSCGSSKTSIGRLKFLVYVSLICAVPGLLIAVMSFKQINQVDDEMISFKAEAAVFQSAAIRTTVDSIDDVKFRVKNLEQNFDGLEDEVSKSAQMVELRKAILILEDLGDNSEGTVQAEADRISAELKALVEDAD